MKIAVMGAGAVGGYFGGLLARAGEDVSFVARGAHLTAIQRSGLTVDSDLSGDFSVRCAATGQPGTLGLMDLVLFTVKMFHNDEAIQAMASMVDPDTVVLTLQNGIDNGDRLAAALGESHVMPGTAFIQARIREPGVIEQRGQLGRVVFGETRGGTSPRGERLLKVFRGAGWNVELSDNVMGTIWQKFIQLTGCAGVNATSQATFGEMRTEPETRALLRDAFLEIISIAKARGAPIGEDALDRAIAFLDGFPEDGWSSLARDFAEGNPMELEGLTGAVVRLGRELGVPTPVNRAIYAMLKPAAERTARARGGQ